MGWLLGAGVLSAAEPPRILGIQSFRVMVGDDPAWSQPTFDDSEWPEHELDRIQVEDASIFWLRGRLELDDEFLARAEPMGFQLLALASCELFLNGELWATNGVVGATPEQEQPGAIDWNRALPTDLGSGEHLVALRCSAHHRGFAPRMGFYVFLVGDYLELATLGWGYSARTLISAGGLLAIGLFYAMSFLFGTRSRSHLWLGLFAGAAGSLVIVESLRVLVGYTYDLHIWRLLTVTFLAWAVNALLIAFVTERFPLPGRVGFSTISLVLTLPCWWIPGFDGKTGTLFLVGLTTSWIWLARALWARQMDALWALTGISLCLGVGFWQPYQFLDYYLFFGLSVLCLFLLASHVLAGARERREHEAIELRSARLEIELLRRHLQPHFLMNTLTALSEWFEEEPEVASEMVQELGQELRILADVSSRSSIPLGQELELCRSHLAVMAKRRDENLMLEAVGLDPTSQVPPAIFHTLLENALTHNAYGADEGIGNTACFRLRQEMASGRIRYVFEAPFRPIGPVSKSEGTGLRYVRARLRESFGEDFRLSAGVDDPDSLQPVWRTVIDVPNGADTCAS